MLALRIALRYLFAPKSHRAVNVISVIAIAGVAVAALAIIVVLSVFNGFTGLSAQQLSRIDPQLLIVPTDAKVIKNADSVAQVLKSLPEVSTAMPSLKERALLVSNDHQMAVVVKGVDIEQYVDVVPFDSIIIDGRLTDQIGVYEPVPAISIAVGPAMQMKLFPSQDPIADLYFPRRKAKINPANPAGAYTSAPVAVTSVFRVDQADYDADLVIAPISLIRQLLEYDTEATAIEIALTDGVSPDDAAKDITKLLPTNFEVLTRNRQQAETFRMIAVEKWITFLMLTFILIVAAFNILSTLSLMVIEKRTNMETLRRLGASRQLIKRVFIAEGGLITIIGGIIGIVIGVALCAIQQHFGLIRLSGDPSAFTVPVYPVAVRLYDILLVLATIFVVGFVVAQLSRLFTRKIA